MLNRDFWHELSRQRILIWVSLGLLLVMYVNSWQVTGVLFLSVIAVICALNRFDKDCLLLCLGIAVLKLLGLLLNQFFWQQHVDGQPTIWVNHHMYLVNLSIDIASFLFVVFRSEIANVIWPSVNQDNKHEQGKGYSVFSAKLIKFELAYLFIFRCYMLVDASAMFENLMRNLEFLGVTEEIAIHFWEWHWIYHSFAPLKRFLNAMELLLLLSLTLQSIREQTRSSPEQASSSKYMDKRLSPLLQD